jgi:hypothetical protein
LWHGTIRLRTGVIACNVISILVPGDFRAFILLPPRESIVSAGVQESMPKPYNPER